MALPSSAGRYRQIRYLPPGDREHIAAALCGASSAPLRQPRISCGTAIVAQIRIGRWPSLLQQSASRHVANWWNSCPCRSYRRRPHRGRATGFTRSHCRTGIERAVGAPAEEGCGGRAGPWSANWPEWRHGGLRWLNRGTSRCPPWGELLLGPGCVREDGRCGPDPRRGLAHFARELSRGRERAGLLRSIESPRSLRPIGMRT